MANETTEWVMAIFCTIVDLHYPRNQCLMQQNENYCQSDFSLCQVGHMTISSLWQLWNVLLKSLFDEKANSVGHLLGVQCNIFKLFWSLSASLSVSFSVSFSVSLCLSVSLSFFQSGSPLNLFMSLLTHLLTFHYRKHYRKQLN